MDLEHDGGWLFVDLPFGFKIDDDGSLRWNFGDFLVFGNWPLFSIVCGNKPLISALFVTELSWIVAVTRVCMLIGQQNFRWTS